MSSRTARGRKRRITRADMLRERTELHNQLRQFDMYSMGRYSTEREEREERVDERTALRGTTRRGGERGSATQHRAGDYLDYRDARSHTSPSGPLGLGAGRGGRGEGTSLRSRVSSIVAGVEGLPFQGGGRADENAYPRRGGSRGARDTYSKVSRQVVSAMGYQGEERDMDMGGRRVHTLGLSQKVRPASARPRTPSRTTSISDPQFMRSPYAEGSDTAEREYTHGGGWQSRTKARRAPARGTVVKTHSPRLPRPQSAYATSPTRHTSVPMPALPRGMDTLPRGVDTLSRGREGVYQGMGESTRQPSLRESLNRREREEQVEEQERQRLAVVSGSDVLGDVLGRLAGKGSLDLTPDRHPSHGTDTHRDTYPDRYRGRQAEASPPSAPILSHSPMRRLGTARRLSGEDEDPTQVYQELRSFERRLSNQMKEQEQERSGSFSRSSVRQRVANIFDAL
ncbi:hypothetical protein KIPB_002516 [Kipferlia bialata]|uniref:Uncharacterized protein n=1 Tax=Kipferlia bialata TaxID=797122 RepID=A0A9K3CQW2_9EUKA|nr:hypothetical protein KIPB_002516 [Kipferlia bialata]|eukprot:g2516.t1